TQPHRRELRLDRVGRPDVDPMLRRGVVKRQQNPPGPSPGIPSPSGTSPGTSLRTGRTSSRPSPGPRPVEADRKAARRDVAGRQVPTCDEELTVRHYASEPSSGWWFP